MAKNGSRIWFIDGLAAVMQLSNSDYTDEARAVFDDYADQILDYAQTNAPWADRTGMARDGLYTEVYEENGEITLVLAHSVDYGQWLETIQSGGFAIIMPTLQAFAPEVFEAAGGHITSEEGGDL